MARYYGKIGFYFDGVEVRPGVWQPIIEERDAFGDVIRNTKRTENQGYVNDNIVLNSQISFVADSYAIDNFQRIKYATYMGTKWAVSSAEVAFPRIILTLGGVYNDQEPSCSSM